LTLGLGFGAWLGMLATLGLAHTRVRPCVRQDALWYAPPRLTPLALWRNAMPSLTVLKSATRRPVGGDAGHAPLGGLARPRWGLHSATLKPPTTILLPSLYGCHPAPGPVRHGAALAIDLWCGGLEGVSPACGCCAGG